MSNLAHVLTKVGEAYKGKVAEGESRVHHLIDLGDCFDGCGKTREQKFERVKVLVPLNRVLDTDRVRLRISYDQGDLGMYHRLENGLCVPEWVAKEAGLSSKLYPVGGSVVVLDRA